MPKLLCARAPEDAEQERKIHKLAASRHAPGDWIFRARIVSLSWQGLRTAKIAEQLGCHPKTVRTRLHRFNAEGIDGLGDRSGAGRKPRITENERSKIIALVGKDPPGKLVTEPGGGLRAEDEEEAAYWTLDTLAEAARKMGIEVGRSQVRRILLAEVLAEGVRWRKRWRNTRRGRALAQSLAQYETVGPERRSGVRPKRSRVVELYTNPPEGSTVVCVDELGPVTPRYFPPAPGWSPGVPGHRIKAPLEYGRGPDKAWVFGALRVEDGKSLTFTSRSRNSKGYIKLLEKIERAIPKGIIHVIADNLKTHKSVLVREWLKDHPRIEQPSFQRGRRG